MEFSTHKTYINSKGEEIPSVTTILKVLNKPALLDWANSLGFKKISYRKELERKANIGTNVHRAIEIDLLNLGQAEVEKMDNKSEEVQARYSRFLEFRDNNVFEPIFIEKSVNNEEYGGTIDCYCTLNGYNTLIDWKTSARVHDTMWMQLSAYHNIVKDDFKVDQVAVVLLHPEEYILEVKPVEELSKYFKVFTHLKNIFKLLHIK